LNVSDFQKEISFAKKGIQEAEKSNGIWTSPKGSYFTPNPLGQKGLAFVYPGAFNSYPGMGRQLFDHFPILHEAVREIIPNISHSLSERHIYPRVIPNHPDQSPQERLEEFYNHPNELIESGISISVLHTLILKDIFQIKPQAAFGYSLGEASMLWANKVWGNADQSSLDWSESPLFRNQLFGEMTTLREFWKDQPLDEDFWGSYILKAPLNLIQSAIEKENQVFLTIINTENEVVIAGLEEACRRVISQIKCHALPMPFNASIHNPGIEARYSDFVDLYRNEVVEKPGMQFYSASDYGPLELSSESLAQSMAQMTCSPVDFPRLVHKAYQDGIRIFVEVGPQKTCSRWIEKILESKPHAVIPINKKNQPDYAGILKVLSMLVSQNVPLDLSPLYSLHKGETKNMIQSQLSGSVREDSQSDTSELDLVYLEHVSRISLDITKSQEDFLNHQAAVTNHIKRILALRGSYPGEGMLSASHPPPLYTEEQIEAFTTGDHRECFGELFAEFENRRIPRLPNGPLRFIDRVVDIKAEKGKVQIGSSLTSQADIPVQEWYLTKTDGSLPYVSLMEAALQPCGFLSAYMGSIRDRSNADLYFRNLDGEITLLYWPDLPGSTVTNRVELISSSTLQDVIIQEYSFELSHEGKAFLQGKSSFGYFTPIMLKNQSGLNGKHKPAPWKSIHPDAGRWIELDAGQPEKNIMKSPHLPRIPRTWISKNGGESKSGYIQAQLGIPEDAWFYQAHFYQDPVMPGSLGVESMAQALAGSSTSLGMNPSPGWRIKPGSMTSWKYRGQITPGVESVEIELHIKELNRENNKGQITADGNLWLGNTRIYEVKDISLEIS
jgi:PfaB family protein